MTNEECNFCGSSSTEVTKHGDKICNSCKAVQLNIVEGDNPFVIVNCSKCGYRHRIYKYVNVYGDPTICNKCRQTSYKWSI